MLRPLRYLIVALTLLITNSFVNGFTNPIKIKDGSDPQLVFWNGTYYLTTTSSIAGLKTAQPKIVWADTPAPRCCSLWAPEIHRIDGRWYIYYTAGPQGTNYGETQRTWVLEGGTGTPLEPYKFLSQVKTPNYDSGMIDAVGFVLSTIFVKANLYTSPYLPCPMERDTTLQVYSIIMLVHKLTVASSLHSRPLANQSTSPNF